MADALTDAAIGRLNAAVDELETKLDTLADQLAEAHETARAFDAMVEDRAALAEEKDAALNRAKSFESLAETAAAEVAEAVAAVRDALADADGATGGDSA